VSLLSLAKIYRDDLVVLSDITKITAASMTPKRYQDKLTNGKNKKNVQQKLAFWVSLICWEN